MTTWDLLEHERRRFNEMDDPDGLGTDGEAWMDKGWLVKARMPDEPEPNVSWFWIPIGNCSACRFYVPAEVMSQPRCLNPNQSISENQDRYIRESDCPGFMPGISMLAEANDTFRRRADVMRAAGLMSPEGRTQPVEILQKLRWTPWRSHQAHAQQQEFIAQARDMDAGIHSRILGDTGDIEE